MNEQILKMVRLFWRFTISVKPVINSVLNWEPRVQTRSKSKLIQKFARDSKSVWIANLKKTRVKTKPQSLQRHKTVLP